MQEYCFCKPGLWLPFSSAVALFSLAPILHNLTWLLATCLLGCVHISLSCSLKLYACERGLFISKVLSSLVRFFLSKMSAPCETADNAFFSRGQPLTLQSDECNCDCRWQNVSVPGNHSHNPDTYTGNDEPSSAEFLVYRKSKDQQSHEYEKHYSSNAHDLHLGQYLELVYFQYVR